MPVYCGFQLSSDVELVDLPLGTPGEPGLLHFAGLSEGVGSEVAWVHHWVMDSEVFLTLGRCSNGLIFRFGDGTFFGYERKSRLIRFPRPLVASTRHQLYDHVLPRVLDDLGHLMIHGSAIDTPNGAVIFIGDTGLGKSTLAASFESAGIGLLSDDCMRLTVDADDTVFCIPTYRSLRLWPDSADAVMPTAPFESMAEDSDKRRLDLPEAPVPAPSTVAAICVLAAPNKDSDAVTFSRLTPARAVSLLLGQCFRLDPTDADATRRTFERCADIVERVPVVELSYPRDFDRLPEVREAVLQRSASADWVTVTST